MNIIIKTLPVILLASASYSHSMEWVKKGLKIAALASPAAYLGKYIISNASQKNVLPTFEEYMDESEKKSKKTALRISAEQIEKALAAQSDSVVLPSSCQLPAVQPAQKDTKEEKYVFVDASDTVDVTGSEGITVIENMEGVCPLHEAIKARDTKKIYQILDTIKTFEEMEKLLYRTYKEGKSAMILAIDLNYGDILQILHRYYTQVRF